MLRFGCVLFWYVNVWLRSILVCSVLVASRVSFIHTNITIAMHGYLLIVRTYLLRLLVEQFHTLIVQVLLKVRSGFLRGRKRTRKEYVHKDSQCY